MFQKISLSSAPGKRLAIPTMANLEVSISSADGVGASSNSLSINLQFGNLFFKNFAILFNWFDEPTGVSFMW
jgi:hypothetical protein